MNETSMLERIIDRIRKLNEYRREPICHVPLSEDEYDRLLDEARAEGLKWIKSKDNKAPPHPQVFGVKLIVLPELSTVANIPVMSHRELEAYKTACARVDEGGQL